MKPILILIRKKVRVPTKFQLKHKWRSDWKKVGKIEYNQCQQLFKPCGGIVGTDAQFAKFLYDNFGTGIFSTVYWKKGLAGVHAFMKVELYADGFRRLPKTKTQEQWEMEKARRRILKLKNKIKKNDGDFDELKSEIDEIREDYDMSKEIETMTSSRHSGVSPYLKSTIPIYKFHAYEEYIPDDNIKQVEPGSLW